MFDEKIVTLEEVLASIKNPAIIKDEDSLRTSTILVKGELLTNPQITLYLKFFGKLQSGSSHMYTRAYDEYMIYKNINKLRQMTYDYNKRQTSLVYKITPNVSKYVATYQIKEESHSEFFIEFPELDALPSYDGWKRDKDLFLKGQWYFNTLCIITSSVEFPLSQVLSRNETINFSDLKAMLYQICHLEACFEDIKLTHSKPHYMVEKHEAPIDLYYQHNDKDECVLIRTRYVIKLSKFDEAMISGNKELGDGVGISSFYNKKIASDNFQFIRDLLESFEQGVETAAFFKLGEYKISTAEVKLVISIMKSSNRNDKLNLLSKDDSVTLEQAKASGQPIYCTPNILLTKLALSKVTSNTNNSSLNHILEKVLREGTTTHEASNKLCEKAQIEEFMASNYGRNDFLSYVRNFCFPDINPFIEQDNTKLTEIAQVLMKNTLKSVLEALLLCFRHYKTDKKIFYILLMGGLVGLFQNEMLIACGVTDKLCVNWKGGKTCRKAVPGFENKYQWVFFDMVKRTEKLVKAQVKFTEGKYSITDLPYNPDNDSIFDMCYYVLEGKEGYAADRDMEANCVLSSLLEGYYFQEMEKLPLNRIFIGLETAQSNKQEWKSLSSMRNNNFPQNQRHPTQGKYATHWTSKIQENNGFIRRFRSGLPTCGPRNLNFGEYFEYIAQSVAYSQINIMTNKLRSKTFSVEDNKKMYVATQLNGILFLLLRATLESKTPLKDIYMDYVANLKRDADVFGQKTPSVRELFQKFYTGINDELVGLVEEYKITMRARIENNN